MATTQPNIYSMGTVQVGGTPTPATKTDLNTFNQTMVKPSTVPAPAVFTGAKATDWLTNTVTPAVKSAGQAVADQTAKNLEAQKKAAEDAAKAKADASATKTTVTPPPSAPGTKTVYKSDGTTVAIPLASDATSLGYFETKPAEKPVSGQATLASGSIVKQFNDGTYGIYNPQGEFLRTAQQSEFNNAKNTQDTLDKINQAVNGAYPLTPSQQAQIDAVRQSYERLTKLQETANANFTGGTTIAQNLYGTANTQMGQGEIKGVIDDGIAKITDIQSKMNSDVAAMTQAFQSDNLEMLQSAYQSYSANQKSLQDALDSTHDEVVAKTNAEEQAVRTNQIAVDNDIRTLLATAQSGNATPEQIKGMQEALANHDYAAAVIAGGDSLLSDTGVAGEYYTYVRDAKSRGITPMSFNDYQTQDANRKARVASAGATIYGNGGNLTKDQLKVINGINSAVTSSPVYKTVNSALTFADGVKASLAEGTGAGDIAAINQFQKVVDEGAVTRDQDVKLISGAQTVMNRLATWKTRNVDTGEVMSPQLRSQMESVIDALVKVKVDRLLKSPEVASQLSIAKGTGVDPTDTILDNIKLFQPTVGDQHIAETADKKTALKTFSDSDVKNKTLVDNARKSFPNATPGLFNDQAQHH